MKNLLINLISTFLLFQNGIAANTDQYQWMDNQISADLAYFRDGITLEMLNFTEKTLSERRAPILRCKIKDGNIEFKSQNIPNEHPRILGFINFIKILAQSFPVPNVDFIVEFDDAFEDPTMTITAPVLNICKRKSNFNVILYPDVECFSWREDLYNFVANESKIIPWDQRIPKAFWRGNMTGGPYDTENWRQAPRSNLALLSRLYPNELDCGFIQFYGSNTELYQAMLQSQVFQEALGPEKQLVYRYLIAIDGNSFPSSQKWQIFSGSLILKNESDFIEWFDNALVPYQHYLPYSQSLSNIMDAIFWAREHDDIAKVIAANALHFGQENLMNQHVLLYFYKLCVKYSLLLDKGM